MFLVYLCFLTPALTAVVHVFWQRTWLRLHVPKSRQAVLLKIILMMNFIYTLFGYLYGYYYHENPWLTGMYMFIGSTGFHYAYFNLFNMSETARRVNICVNCFKAEREGRSWKPERYSNQYMVETRLERLVEMGALKKNGNKYIALEGWILRAAQGLQLLHSIYFPKRG